jgi:P27 family predicted phage terminase small subunit
MRVPDDLESTPRKLFRATIRHLERLGVYRSGDEAAVERYVRAVARGRQLRELVDREGMIVTGSHDQPMAHPASRHLRYAELDAHRFAEALFLTPKSRAQAGITMTDDDDDEWAREYGLLDE